jgi:hypothetical protein
MPNHLYRLGTIDLQTDPANYAGTLFCCAYSPYKLCRKCPLYYGVKPSCSSTMINALDSQRSRYSVYGLLDDLCDVSEVPSKGCRNSRWRNMKPVVETLTLQKEEI